MPDVLNTVPGLNVVQTGGPGGQTSVFMRGTNSNHTKVLVDGIDVSDPSTPNGAFDFAHLLAADILQLEVLRGPQSGLYGSDAIGGIISIVTQKGDGSPRATASIETGSFKTFNQTAGLSGSQDNFNYALNVAHLHAGDIPVTPLELMPPGQKAAVGHGASRQRLARHHTRRLRIRDDRAIADFSREIEIEPDNADAYRGRSLAYARRQNPTAGLADVAGRSSA